MAGDDLDRGHAGLEPDDRQREQDQDQGCGGPVEVGVAPEPLAPAGEAGGAVLARVHPAERERVDLRAELRQHRRQQGQGRGEHEEDAEHDPERHRAEGGAGDEHHRRERDQHGQAGEEDGLAGGVHRHRDRVARREFGAEEGAAEAVDDEERVVDPEREREHEREVHRPDRDLEAVREQREQPGGGDEAEDRQQQRQPGGDERAEGEHEDRHRHRPGEELRLQHRVAVGGVEVAPHPGGAGERDGDRGGAGGLQLRLERVGGGDHRGRIPVGARRSRPRCVRRQRCSSPRAAARPSATWEFARRTRSTRATVWRKPASLVVSCCEWTTTISAELERPAKFRWMSVACLDGLGAVRLPAGPGERGLDLRREEAERDGEDRPGDRDGADVVGGPAAQPADRADRLRLLGRGCGDADGRVDDRHRLAPLTSSFRLRSCCWTEPQTSSQSASTPSSTIR